MSLQSHINNHISLGSLDMSYSLGIQKMPEGYALMLNPDRSHYYWLRFDGVESVICWDKWAIYHGAKSDKSPSPPYTLEDGADATTELVSGKSSGFIGGMQ